MKPVLLFTTFSLLLCALGLANKASAEPGHFMAGNMAEGAPAELMHWGQLVGQWSTTEESLKPDGSGWKASNGADWDFFWAYDGWGIQDNYTSPPISQKLEDESTRQRGINLRIFNPDKNEWVLTWLTTKSTLPQTFKATTSKDKLVMFTEEKDSRGNYHRITFFDMNDRRFKWKLEWSQDRESWLEVHRINAIKKNRSDVATFLR